jgi:glutaminyl-peptide cyclotransferase
MAKANPHEKLSIGATVCSRGLVAAAVAVAVLLQRFGVTRAAQVDAPAMYGYRVVNVYPHDSRAYTQGLIYLDGFLFESTGLNGRSTLRKVKLETGDIIRQVPIDSAYFAEGLTDWHGLLVQLTWQSHVGFIYDMPTLNVQRTFTYSGEGWGLTRDRTRLIMSDGSDSLRFLDPETLRETGRVAVRDGSLAIRNLNELEYVRDEIFANVWHTDRIARIAPETGRVTGWIDLRGLLSQVYRLEPEAVLNGIAYDEVHDRLFVTGKLWPKLFEIRLDRRR